MDHSPGVFSNYLADPLFLFGHLELALWLSVAFKPKNLGTAHRGTALTQLSGQLGEANLKIYIFIT